MKHAREIGADVWKWWVREPLMAVRAAMAVLLKAAEATSLHCGLSVMPDVMSDDGSMQGIHHTLRGWMARVSAVVHGLGPYALIEVILPGGSLIALLLWFYRQGRTARMELDRGSTATEVEVGASIPRKGEMPAANRRTCSPPREARATLPLMNIVSGLAAPQFSLHTSGYDARPRLQFDAVGILGRDHMRHSLSIAAPAAVVLAITAALSLTGGGGSAAAQAAAAPPPPQVDVAQVVARKVTEFDEFTGRFEAVERVEIRPRVSGYIASVDFAEGREVKKGDVLFVIDPRPYEADYKHAKAQLDQARSQSMLAKSERERATKLLQAHAISQEEYDTRVAGLQQADANVEAAQAAVDTAALNLSFTRVTAPISGRISRALVTEGNLVSAGQTMLTTLVSLDPIYVRFDGDEQAYLKYTKLARENAEAHARAASANAAAAAGAGKASKSAGGHKSAAVSGQAQAFADNQANREALSDSQASRQALASNQPNREALSTSAAGKSAGVKSAPQVEAGEAGAEVMVGLANEPGYPHQGVMVFVDNELDPTTGTIRGRAKLENHDRVFTPGLFARVKLMGSNQYDALLINDSAIGTDQTVRYVLVVGAENKVEYRPVKLGPIIDGLRVITDGLKPGETIVVNGLQRVRPGSPVNPERVAMGERQRGDKPQTLYARNAKLAANTGPSNAVASDSSDVQANGDAPTLNSAASSHAAGSSAASADNAASANSAASTTYRAGQSAQPAASPNVAASNDASASNAVTSDSNAANATGSSTTESGATRHVASSSAQGAQPAPRSAAKPGKAATNNHSSHVALNSPNAASHDPDDAASLESVND